MFGFSFSETMSGTWSAPGSAEARPIRFSVTARARSWLRHLRDKKADLDGTLSMDGVAREVPVHGELLIDPLFGRVIRYQLAFTGDDGKPYHLRGQKDVTVADPVGSMTTLPASIYGAGDQLVGTAQLAFDTKDLPRFLGSFRPSF
jgi:hypothetical protein